MKKITFENRLEAISWIAEHAEDEGQFEVMREMLNYNFIYSGAYFLDLSKPIDQVVMIDKKK